MALIMIGLIVGGIMGLTGAGGALVSIPLFLAFLNTSLKEATVLSLVAVISGTLLNLFGQKEATDKKFVLVAVIFGAVSNAASLPLKDMTPDWLVATLLSLIALYSIWSVWAGKLQGSSEKKGSLLKMVFTGLALGLITTLTGLGGGVILVPVLLKVFGKSYDEAMPTSLLSIMLISGLSFAMQVFKAGYGMLGLTEIGLIFTGSVLASLGLRMLTKNISAKTMDITRRVVFTLVTVYSISTIMIKIS